MNALIDVNRIRRHAKQRNEVHELQFVMGKNTPISLQDAVVCFVAIHYSKVEWAVSVGVGVGEIQPPPKWNQFLLCSKSFGCVRRTDEVSLSGQRWGGVIAEVVMLKPVLLINGIKPNVVLIQGVKLDKETAVLEA